VSASRTFNAYDLRIRVLEIAQHLGKQNPDGFSTKEVLPYFQIGTRKTDRENMQRRIRRHLAYWSGKNYLTCQISKGTRNNLQYLYILNT